MNMAEPPVDFATPNPHALAIILDASETQSIIASRDIFDIQGIKLWARDQPVSADLHRKLLDRTLSRPLESCLTAENGISPKSLVLAVQALIIQEGHLSPLLKPHALALQKGAAVIWLHPVVQLLLSAEQAANPRAFAHAIEAMAVAGALAKARGGNERQVTQAMTAGLVHDIGEMYMAPEHGEAEAALSLDVDTYRHLVVHPHVGQLLLGQLTDYGKDIVRAVGEHHEHLDGSGYPHRLVGEQISPLGRLLAATECALLALRVPGGNLHHASVALRVVPGEFDEHLSGPLSAAARSVTPLTASSSLPQLQTRLQALDSILQTSLGRLDAMDDPEHGSEGLQRAVAVARHLLRKLRQGWNESGLWAPDSVEAEQASEVEAVLDALRGRLQAIDRSVRLSAGAVSDEETEQLDALCSGWAADGT